MTYVLTFLAGGFIGGTVGVFAMCGMIAAKEADKREAWFNDEQRGG